MNKLFIFFSFSFVLFFSCKKENNPCFKSRGDTETERRELPSSIRIVTLENNINLFIVQDSSSYISLEAGENLLDFIDTQVEGNELTISNNNKCNFLRTYKKKINAYLHIADLDSIEMNGSGNLTIADTFYTDHFVFNLSRTTGDVDVVINCKSQSRFNLHNGASKVTARGISRYNIAYNSGSGWFYFDELSMVFSQVNSKSSGNCYVGKSRTMFILLNGSGDIVYSKEPESIEIWEHFGSGRLIKNLK
jgi:hypothetical protein